MSHAVNPRLELGTVRGIACVALVAYHVIGPGPANGMHLPDSSVWHRVMNGLDFLRMPLFSVMSGYFYAKARADRCSIAGFLSKKLRRLGVPLLFGTTVMFLLRSQVYGDVTSYSDALFFHYQHYWFLQALLLIFAVVAVWDAISPARWQGLSVGAFATLMVSRSFYVTQFFSLSGALYLAPFFLSGMILRIEPAVLRRPELPRLALWAAGIVMAVHQLATVESGLPVGRNSFPAAVCGFAGAYLLFVRCPKIPFFEVIAKYSFTIYLWHSIAASMLRQATERVVHLPVPIEFLLLLSAGVAIPVALHLVVRRIPLLSTLVAGIEPASRDPVPVASATTHVDLSNVFPFRGAPDRPLRADAAEWAEQAVN